MRIYIIAPREAWEQTERRAEKLRSLGHEITSSWHEEEEPHEGRDLPQLYHELSLANVMLICADGELQPDDDFEAGIGLAMGLRGLVAGRVGSAHLADEVPFEHFAGFDAFAEQLRLAGEGDEEARRCRECGCTEHRGCPTGCFWTSRTLCSACSQEDGEIIRAGPGGLILPG